MKLSVLDIIPVRSDQTSADSFAATLALAKLADELGFERYWLAEHHNMPDIAATSPGIHVGIIAATTKRMRVGSGAVLLPNHAPLVVAEQFATLEAAFPGRIDLGIGRASGTDPITAWALRGGAQDSPAAAFVQNLDAVGAMMSRAGAQLTVAGRRVGLAATPAAASVPAIWLLGSSDYSARLAASKGLPYVFAHHFSGHGTEEALALYRRNFIPSATLDAPKTFLIVNASVAETDEEALRRSLPQALGILALRTGAPLQALRLIEDAEAVSLSASQRAMLDTMRSTWVIGSPKTARTQLDELTARFDVDEVMVNPLSGSAIGTDPTTAPGREDAIRLLAAAVRDVAQVERVPTSHRVP